MHFYKITEEYFLILTSYIRKFSLNLILIQYFNIEVPEKFRHNRIPEEYLSTIEKGERE